MGDISAADIRTYTCSNTLHSIWLIVFVHIFTSGFNLVLFRYIIIEKIYLLFIFLEVQSSSFATRPITAIKTKGAVGIRLMLFGSRFLFINSHFSGQYCINLLKTHYN